MRRPRHPPMLDAMLRTAAGDVSWYAGGLQPDVLAAWYERIIADTVEMAPPWLADKVSVRQDPVLPMRFSLDISKRAVRYFMVAVDNNLERMPYTTGLYFLKVQEELASEMDRSLV